MTVDTLIDRFKCTVLSVAVCAIRRDGASFLLAAPLEMCTQCESTILATRPIVDDAYPYLYRPYSTRAEGLLYLYIVGLVVNVWISYGYGYTGRSGRGSIT